MFFPQPIRKIIKILRTRIFTGNFRICIILQHIHYNTLNVVEI